MMINAEETALNADAIARHPEVGDWSAARYDTSAYKRAAEEAKAGLQALIDAQGIDAIELNPHRDGAGTFDGRVDDSGRYLGLVFGGGQCLNAGMVEQGFAAVWLHGGGDLLEPSLALKEFYSYRGTNVDSVGVANVHLASFTAQGGALETLCALAYASGSVFTVGADFSVRFREAPVPDRVVFFDPRVSRIELGASGSGLVNTLHFSANPLDGVAARTYARDDSRDAYGAAERNLALFSLKHADDADKFVGGLLDDVAYPEGVGFIAFFEGDGAIQVGDVVEVRGEEPRRLDLALGHEWAGRYTGKLVRRVRAVQHRFAGNKAETKAFFTSPVRSVASPLSFLTQSQPDASAFFAFGLDTVTAVLDSGFHLD